MTASDIESALQVVLGAAFRLPEDGYAKSAKHIIQLILLFFQQELLDRETAFYLITSSTSTKEPGDVYDEISELSGILELPENQISDMEDKLKRIIYLIERL